MSNEYFVTLHFLQFLKRNTSRGIQFLQLQLVDRYDKLYIGEENLKFVVWDVTQ